MKVQIEELNKLIRKDFDTNSVALHGSSFEFIQSLIDSGQISKEGNYDNHFYLLIDPHRSGVDIRESAIYYAHVNSIKDLLFSLHPYIKDIVNKAKLDHYLFQTGLAELSADNTSLPYGFEIFEKTDIINIIAVINKCKAEDRKGVLIYFSKQLLQDFKPDPVNDVGQTRILLSKPLELKHISSIELVGRYEKEAFRDLLV